MLFCSLVWGRKQKQGEEKQPTGSWKCHQRNCTLSHRIWLKFNKEYNNVVINPPWDPYFTSTFRMVLFSYPYPALAAQGYDSSGPLWGN